MRDDPTSEDVAESEMWQIGDSAAKVLADQEDDDPSYGYASEEDARNSADEGEHVYRVRMVVERVP